jgi:hypothetical protein
VKPPSSYLLDYLNFLVIDSSTLAGDLQRILSTMRELDERAQGEFFFYTLYTEFKVTLQLSPSHC